MTTPDNDPKLETLIASARPDTGGDVETFLAWVNTEIDREQVSATHQPSTSRIHMTWMSSGVATAAAIAIAFLITYTRVPAYREIASASGVRTAITLGDGTHVILAPDSKLRIPVGYAANRTVNLTGEAYFAVIHDTRHPFAVLTHNVQINDVGTEFDVRAYDADIRVAVAKGAVALVGAGRGNGATGFPQPSMNWGTVSRTRPSFPSQDLISTQGIPLSAGDVAEVVNGVPMVTHHANIAAFTGWQQGHLIFQATPLREVVQTISRTFDVHITLSDSALATRLVTASFNNQPVDVVLKDVTAILGADFQRTGREVTIVGGGGARKPPGSLGGFSGPPFTPLRTTFNRNAQE